MSNLVTRAWDYYSYLRLRLRGRDNSQDEITFFLSTEKSIYIKPDTLDLGWFLSHAV